MSRSGPTNDPEGPGPLGGLMSSFRGYYRPTMEARVEAFRSGLVIFDANALLDLYRFVPPARSEFLELIRSIKDRIFIPYQIAHEFHVRRIDAVAGRALEFENQRHRLDEIRGQVRGFIRQISQRAHAEQERVRELIATSESALDDVNAFLDVMASGYDLDPDTLATSPSDPIISELAEILDGRVATEPSGEVLAADREEAQRRIHAKLPPGFADKAKGDDAAGDYLWWAEVVRYASETSPKAVIIVSNDIRKGDWVYERRGFRIGPDPRLVSEMNDASGAELYWATTSEFLADLSDALGSDAVSDSTLEEARLSRLLPDVIDAIVATVRSAEHPLVSSAVANAALAVDPSLSDTAWAGAGSFRSFLDTYVPELQFVIPPAPGYILDPAIHSDTDVPPSRRGLASSEDDPTSVDAQVRGYRAMQIKQETLEQLRRSTALSPETLEELRNIVEPPPETLERLRKATEIPPETLDAVRRLFE